MEVQEQKKNPSEQNKRERGVAEHEQAHYSSLPADEKGNRDKERKDSDIRETDDASETDTGASDLAGTASGNLEPNGLPDEEE